MSHPIPVRVAEPGLKDRVAEPVTAGVPLPRGWTSAVGDLGLARNGELLPIPVDVEVAERAGLGVELARPKK